MTIRYSCDIAIVGAGIAGMAAALRAAECGLSGLVLEKLSDPQHVCNSRLTGGLFHAALGGVLDSPEEIAARIRLASDGAADVAQTEAIAADSRRVIRWLQSHGIRFMRSGREPSQEFTLSPPALPQFGRRWQGRAGDVLLRTLEARLNSFGGKVIRGHRARRLLMKEGRCTGVAGVMGDDVEFEVDARSVVIADGGFQANPDMLRRHVTPDPSRLCQRNAGTGMGDGMTMAQAVGAALINLSQFYGHLLSRDSLQNSMLWYPWADEIARSSIIVGPDGMRFADEGLGGVYLANQVARLPDPASALVVFDEDTWQGPGTLRALSVNPHMVRAGGTLISAMSIAELAERTGLAASALIGQVEAYNSALEGGALSALTPPRTTPKSAACPIRRAPFHALPIAPGITYTMGGIHIDADSRALTPEGAPILGLYAAGTSTGGLEGGPRLGYVGGLVKSAITGLRAGEHAARLDSFQVRNH